MIYLNKVAVSLEIMETEKSRVETVAANQGALERGEWVVLIRA